MTVERPRPAVLRVTLHAYEAAALVAAARWVAEGARGEMPSEAVSQLREVLGSYDDAMRRLSDSSSPRP